MSKVGVLSALFAAALGAPLVLAQEIKIQVTGQGKVEVAPQARPAAPEPDEPLAIYMGDGARIAKATRAMRQLAQLEAMIAADGDLTDEEAARLIERARERFQRDMSKLEARERRNEAERNGRAKAEESQEIQKARYRASLRALDRDLVYRIDRLRKAGGDKYERNLDDLTDKVKDTYADLHDKIVDSPAATWPTTLEVARKFHADFLSQIEKWGKEIGVDSTVPNADQRLKVMHEELVARAKRLRKMGGEKYEDSLNSVIDRVNDAFEDLREKVDETPPAGWAALVATGDKFVAQYNIELDKWAKQVGADEGMPSPTERLNALSRNLLDRISDTRDQAGDRFEENLDGIEDKVRDTFAELREKVLSQSRELWATTLEDAARFHREYGDQIDLVRLQLEVRRPAAEPDPAPRAADPKYPERDLPLPRGGHADIVDGIRIARVQPILRRQLGLENGLEVKEITDADAALARVGIEVYDILIDVNGTKVDTRQELRDVMEGVKAGDEYKVVIMRRGKQQTLSGRK